MQFLPHHPYFTGKDIYFFSSYVFNKLTAIRMALCEYYLSAEYQTFEHFKSLPLILST
jgi:hypothetical protein